MRGYLCSVLAVLAICCFFAASPIFGDYKSEAMLVGKWEPVNKLERVQAVIEFMKEGKVKIRISSGRQELNLEGTYKFTDENTVQIQLDSMGKKDTKRLKIVKLTKEELTTKDEGKEELDRFKRVK